jgi:KamA family protein
VVNSLEALPQLTRLRIHSRLPVVIPSRITTALCERFSNSKLKIIIVMHINHANEIDKVLINKMKLLKSSGVTLLNQAVLLKGVNDTSKDLVNLSEKLFSADILPYYLHLLDKVSGASHFDVSEEKSKQLMLDILSELPGFLVPKLVREIGGEKNKTPINLIVN